MFYTASVSIFMANAKFKCPICLKSVGKCPSIQCDICDLWIHQAKCSGLNRKQFEVLCQPNSESWHCPKCLNLILPFPHESKAPAKSSDATPGTMSDELKSLFCDLNDIVTGIETSDDDECEIQFQSNNCSYLNCNEFNSIFSSKPTNFSAFHLNIASMPKHFDELRALLAQLDCKFSLIGITETRNSIALNRVPEQDHDFKIYGYKKFATPTESSVGGVSMYVSDTCPCKPRDDLRHFFYQANNLEAVFVEINQPKRTNIVVGTIYKHPCMSVNTFNSDFLKPLLHKISSEKKQILLLGDFNINLLKSNEDPEVMSFLDIMGSSLILPQILLPTRVAERTKTLIDNIFSSPTGSGTIAGNLCYSISDHLPQFCLFTSLEPGGTGQDGPSYQHDWSKFDQEDFVLDFLSIDWDTLFERFSLNPDQCFNVFNDKMKVLIDQHVPTVKLTKRQLKSKLKPWLTSGILRSISKRDYFYRKFLKASDASAKAQFFDSYKSYRNLIVTLIRQSKVNHYTSYFDHHSNNIQKVWSGVRDLISLKSNSKGSPISLDIGDMVTSKPETVANCFNDFFTNIAEKIRSKMTPAHNHFSSYMKNPNQSSLDLAPTTPEEVIEIISSFSTSKSTGPNSIPVRILKLLKHDISKPIATLINRSFEEGVFPSALKVSKVVPVYKNKGSPLEVSNYRPISLLSNIEKIFEKIMHN